MVAGLAVGGLLAGFAPDTGALDKALEPLLELDGMPDLLDRVGLVAGGTATPLLILLGLAGGVRLAATTLLVAHRLLSWSGHTGYAAYGLAAAAVTLGSCGLLAIADVPPPHGWLADATAGAGTGLLYRLLAGVEPSASPAGR